MREAAERLELAQEAGKVGVYDIDLESDSIVWSDKLVSMIGLPAGTQPSGRAGWLACLHPDDRERASAYFDQCVAGTETYLRNSWRIVRPDGEVRWFLEAARISATHKEKPCVWLGSMSISTTRNSWKRRWRSSWVFSRP